MAAAVPTTPRVVQDRAAAAAGLLTQLGGLVEVEEQNGRLTLCGYRCPFAAVVPAHPELCGMVPHLLAGVVGQAVQERCAREAPVWCRFEVAVA